MKKLSVVALSMFMALGAVGSAFAAETSNGDAMMSKDSMMKKDGMSKDSMSKDAMKKDATSKDEAKDPMSH